jgi:quercetin dioxygenase-like cupin family protein
MSSGRTWSVPRGNDQQWIERRGNRDVTWTDHPVRDERVEFLNEPDDPTKGPLTLKFYLGVGHEVPEHVHPKQTETITVNYGEIRAVVDGESRTLDVGDHIRIPPGVPHEYTVVSDEAAVLAVSITPGLQFKEFVLAEHALSADEYPKSGLNMLYYATVTREYGPMIAAPDTLTMNVLGRVFSLLARVRSPKIPDEPLPIRNGTDGKAD